MAFSILFLGAALAASVVPFPSPVVVTAADGTKLAASWGVPQRADRGVVLVHAYGRNKEDWWTLGDKLYRDGNAVITLDLRGHGANAVSPPREITQADRQAMIGDVAAAVAQLERRGVKQVALVGAEFGANLAANVAVDTPQVASMVLLSPGLVYQGIIVSDAPVRYGNRPMALVAGTDDAYGARSAGVLDAAAIGAHELRLLEGAGKGMKMLSREPSLEGWIVGWIATHWEPAAASARPAPISGVPKVITMPTITPPD